jgi:hypothetical protein
MFNNPPPNDLRYVFSPSTWIQSSIGEANVPYFGTIIDGVYSAISTSKEIIIVEAGQEWFSSKIWQEMENEASLDLAEGRYSSFSNMEDFIADLNN